MVLNCSNLDCILQVSFSSLHDGGDDVFVILERKNGQKAMAIFFFFGNFLLSHLYDALL